MPAGANSWFLKEHKNFASFSPSVGFDVNASKVRMHSLGGGLGNMIIFKNFTKSEITGAEIKITWQASHDLSSASASLQVFDGSYDRTSSSDFPSGSSPPTKGGGNLHTTTLTGTFAETTTTFTPNWSGSTQTDVSIWVYHNDGWSTNYNHQVWLKTVEISEYKIYSFSGAPTVTMEVTGTDNDYGYADPVSVTNLPKLASQNSAGVGVMIF